MLVCGRFSWAARLLFSTLLLPAQVGAQSSASHADADARDAVSPPVAISTPITYPDNESGSATLELELTLDRDGQVILAQLIAGDPRLGSFALSAARHWQFEPARRRGQPVPARIRYSVQFTPPTGPEAGPEQPKPVRAKSPDPTPVPVPPPTPKPVEIVVQGQHPPPGVVVLSRGDTRLLPGTFGDPLRAIEAQPGVVPIVSGLPAFFIRGAPPANVGFFFDGIELPLLYHAFFGPSVIHPGFIDAIDFYPGAAPAKYGRFAGPIVAAKARPLNDQPSGEADLRLIDAGGIIESGPLQDCRAVAGRTCSDSGVRVAGRYSYAGLVLSLLSDAKLSYWDYQTQASYPLGPHDTLGVLAFGGYDLFRAPQSSVNSGAELTFHRVDVRWDRRFGADSSLRVALTGGFDRAAGSDAPSNVVTDRSLRVRTEFDRGLGVKARLHAGLDARLDRFGLEADARNLNYLDFSKLFPTRTDGVAGGYVSFEWEPAKGVHVAPGLRADLYSSQGITAVGVDPRVAAEFEISRVLRLEHSLGIAHQRPSFAAQVPGAQVADLSTGLQWALLWSSGVRIRLPSRMTASASVFRSAYFHALDPYGRARDFTIDRTELDRRTTVSAAGLELQLTRPITQRLGGFISYTLSRSEESIGNQKSPSGFDRPHVLQAALSYDFGHGLTVGARSVLYSGVPELNLEGAPHFTGRRRGTPFFRLDLRAEKRFRIGQRGYWGVIAEILNATSTREVVRLDCGEVCRERVAGPVILPSVGLQAGF